MNIFTGNNNYSTHYEDRIQNELPKEHYGWTVNINIQRYDIANYIIYAIFFLFYSMFYSMNL